MTGRVKAKGRLRHRFFGEYSAVVGLEFADGASARDAARTLGWPWTVGTSSDRVLVAVFDAAALDAAKKRLGAFGADVKKIDSLRKSVDYGEPFEVVIPVAAGEQLPLFEVA